MGDVFTDLCKGPHVKDTGGIGAFKLVRVAGAYWRGDEKRNMLTRIYGVAFATEKELEEYLKRQEEANEVFKSAKEKEEAAAEKARQYDEKLAEAEEEKKQILSEARKNADGQYQQIVAQAKASASEIKTAAATEANREKEQIIASAKKEIADIIVDATTKVVGGQTGAQVDSSLFDEFIDKAGE